MRKAAPQFDDPRAVGQPAFSVDPHYTAGLLMILVLLLTWLGVGIEQARLNGHDHLWGLMAKFDLNGEGNIPAWFSSVLLLAASAVLAVVAAICRRGRRVRVRWLVLACVFAGLSIDEFAGIHELLNRPLRAALHTGGLLYFPWVLVGAGVALTMVAAFGRLVLAQPPPVRSPLIVAAALFLSGAIGVEMLAAPYYETVGKATLIHSLLVTLEEFLEMSGVAVFIYGLLRLIARDGGTVRLSVAPDGRGARKQRSAADLTIDSKLINRSLIVAVAALVTTSLAGQIAIYVGGAGDAWGLARLFNVARERNIPTWFSAAALLLCAMLLWLVAASRPGHTLRPRWRALSALFVFLSFDEAAALHELLVDPLRDSLNAHGPLYYPWILVGTAVLATVALLCRPLLVGLTSLARTRIVTAGVLFAAGALGFEALGGWQADVAGRANLTYALLTTVEELCELAGVAMLARALLDQLATERTVFVWSICGALPQAAVRQPAEAPSPEAEVATCGTPLPGYLGEIGC